MPNLHKETQISIPPCQLLSVKAVAMMIIIIISILREQLKTDCHQHKLTLESE